jgi:multiple sugar transport system substrate-binding protein
LWAWGVVFGGQFFNPEATSPERMITADSPEIVRALQWMEGYSQRYGTSALAEFRSRDQALNGYSFAMLRDRRYAVAVDGQWRARDIADLQARYEGQNLPLDQYVVAPLPTIDGGRRNAGWISGHVFVIPRDADNREGAWEFARFWAGIGAAERNAAAICASGGWIPASQGVVDQPAYQAALKREPMLRQFVELAASENQIPIPSIPAASYYVQQINQAVKHLLHDDAEGDAQRVLQDASDRARARLHETLDEL